MDELDEAYALLAEFITAIPPTRIPGKRRYDLNIDWELGEKLYVQGELRGEAEKTVRVYPGYAAIAKRIGTSKVNVQGRARRYNWLERREEFRKTNGISDGVVSDSKVLLSGPGARKKARRSAEAILLEYLDLFSQAVRDKKVRYDTVGDLDKAIRLLAFVRGQAEATKTVRHVVSLEAMQARHREHRAHIATNLDDGVAGVLSAGGVTIEADGEEVKEELPTLATMPNAKRRSFAEVEPESATVK